MHRARTPPVRERFVDAVLTCYFQCIMLKSLRRIVQEVSGAEDLASALGIIVQRVRAAMETQACSAVLVPT